MVHSPTIKENRVSVPFSPSNSVSRFFNGTEFFVEYSEPVDDVPSEILTIPALANIATVAWATDASLRINTIDQAFLESLREIQSSFSQLYSFLETDSEIYTEEIISRETPEPTTENQGMLFSGGLDSVATFMRHQEDRPMLFSAQGIDIELGQSEAWDQTRRDILDFANMYDTDSKFMKTNCYTFVNRPLLSAHFGYEITDNSWWSGVQHGLGLLGLCAPLTVKYDISTLQIGSSYTAEFNRPWGSHPEIDNNVRWRTTTANHDGFKYSRQEKINQLAEIIDPDETFLIRACYEAESGRNCGQCEKCCRTILGLLIAGLDPEDFGFPVNDDLFAHIRNQIESGAWQFGYDENYFWEDLRRHSPPPETISDPDLAEFYVWLQSVTFMNVHNSKIRSIIRNLVWASARYSPDSVYRVAYPLYSRLNQLRKN